MGRPPVRARVAGAGARRVSRRADRTRIHSTCGRAARLVGQRPLLPGRRRALRSAGPRGAAAAGHARNRRPAVRRAATRRRGRRTADQHLGHVAGAGSCAIAIPRRVYLDLDPAFNQLWHAVEGIDVGLDGHTHYVTVGNCIGRAACDVPTCGRTWITTLQPIVLSEWPVSRGDRSGPVDHRRQLARLRVDSLPGQAFRPEGPFAAAIHGACRAGRASGSLLALAIHPAEADDLAALTDNGWGLVDPAAVAATPDDYRAFIHASKGGVRHCQERLRRLALRAGSATAASAIWLPAGRCSPQDTGLRRHHPDRLRARHLFDGRRSDCRDRGDQPQLRRSRAGRRANWPRRASIRSTC